MYIAVCWLLPHTVHTVVIEILQPNFVKGRIFTYLVSVVRDRYQIFAGAHYFEIWSFFFFLMDFCLKPPEYDFSYIFCAHFSRLSAMYFYCGAYQNRSIYVYNFPAHFIISWCSHVARYTVVVLSVHHLLVCFFCLFAWGLSHRPQCLKFILG